jgi:hypothetical protein
MVALAELVLGGDVPRSVQVSLRQVAFAVGQSTRFVGQAARSLELDAAARQTLFANPAFASLVETLATGFLLITPIEPRGLGRERRVFKYAYSEPLSPRQRGLLWSSFGIEPVRIDFDVPLIGDAQGYHLECQVPEDLQIVDVTLVASVRRRRFVRVEPGRGDVAHVFLSRVPATAEGTATVRIRPTPDGILRATAASAAVILFTLVVGAWLGGRIATGSEPAAALLLLVPGLLSTVVSKPGEHKLSSMVLRGLRWSVALASFCSFLAAGAIALLYDGAALRWTFACLAAVTAVVVAVLRVALRKARRTAHEAG